MKKIIKFLSLIITAFVMVITLVSCGSGSFYKDYHGAGADIEKDHCFDSIDVSDAKKMISNKESFIVFLGSYKNDTCVTVVSNIQSEVDNIDYEGSILYIDITSVVKSTTKIKSAAKSLNIKETTLTSYKSTIVLMYKDGILKMDSEDSTYSDATNRFSVGNKLSYRAVVDFIAESDVYSRTK